MRCGNLQLERVDEISCIVFSRHEVCRQAFSEIYSLSHHSLQSLQEFVEAGPIAPLPHKLSGRPASYATSAGLKADIITFIRYYEASFGMPQPAASCGARNTPPRYLPASLTVLQLFQTFQTDKPDANITCFIFRKVWLESAADIKIMKRRNDVCDRCDKVGDRMCIARTVEQLASVTQWLVGHLKVAREERQFYNDIISAAKDCLADPTSEEPFAPSITHITFDFAQ